MWKWAIAEAIRNPFFPSGEEVSPRVSSPWNSLHVNDSARLNTLNLEATIAGIAKRATNHNH